MSRTTAIAPAADARPPELGGLTVAEFLTWAAGDKAAAAYGLQAEGMTYPAIGARLGAGEARVMKLLRQARDRLEEAPVLVPFYPLPARVVSACRDGGYKNPRDLLKPFRQGTLHRIPGVGVGAALVLSEWLGKRAAKLEAPAP